MTMTMTVNASHFAVATEAELDAIVQDNFPAGRPARSAVYHEGLRAKLCARLQGKFPSCPYLHGSTELDAYFAGYDEGTRILRFRDTFGA